MKANVIVLVLFIGSCKLLCQELIPNGSFEKFRNCPSDISQTEEIIDWWNPSGIATPDYFHSCNTDSCTNGVPSNGLGDSLYAAHGEAYVGTVVAKVNPDNLDIFKEYLIVELIEELKTDEEYIFSVSLRKTDISTLGIGFDAHLSDSKITQNQFYNIDVEPNLIRTESIIHNNWQTYSSRYKALGGERYLLIGNFNKEEEIFENLKGGQQKPLNKCADIVVEDFDSLLYNLIDNLSLHVANDVNIHEVINIEQNVVPNPIINNEVTIKYFNNGVSDRADLTIWGIDGAQVMRIKQYRFGERVRLSNELAKGIYILQVNTKYKVGVCRILVE